MPDPEFVRRVRERIAWFDKLPPETRALINEHSQRIVQAFLDAGMTDPCRIAHVIGVLTDTGVYGNGKAGGKPAKGVGDGGHAELGRQTSKHAAVRIPMAPPPLSLALQTTSKTGL